MKIVKTSVWECVQPVDDATWAFAKGKVPEMRGWIVEITDDAGHTGYGFAHALAQISSTSGSVRGALDFLLPKLHGRDDEDRPALLEELDAALFTPNTAKVGIEMALIDLAGRRAGLSSGLLLGGRFRDTIKLSRIIPLKSPEDMAAVAVKLVAEGYGTLKLKLSGDADLDVRRVVTVREAVGKNVVFTLDPNQAYTMKGFMRLFERIEPCDIAVVEQPVHYADLEALRVLTRALPTVIEADESARSAADVALLARNRAVDAVNMKVTKFKSVRDAQIAMALCEANGIEVRFGTAFGPSLLQAFNAHLAASARSMDHACELAEHLHLGNDPFSPLRIEKGVLHVPKGPGTGVNRV